MCESVWCVVSCVPEYDYVRVFAVLYSILPITAGVSAEDLRWHLCKIDVKDMGTQTRCVRVGRRACMCAGVHACVQVCVRVCSLTVYTI